MGCCKVVEGRRKQGPVRCEHPAAISAGEVAAQGAREQACRAFSLAESDRPTRQILVARGAALLRKMRVSLKFIELGIALARLRLPASKLLQTRKHVDFDSSFVRYDFGAN